jgi:hypothetical protein
VLKSFHEPGFPSVFSVVHLKTPEETMPTISIVCQHQEKSNWCWAAAVASVNNYYAKKSGGKRPTVTQTDLAKKYVGGKNEQYDPYQVLVDLKLSNGSDDGFIDWATLKDTVNDGEPNIAKVGGSSSGHYILVIGYEDPGTERQRRYVIADPDESPADPKTLTKGQLESYGGSYDGTQYTKDMG